MDCNFLMKDRLHSNLERAKKFWMTPLSHLKLQYFSITTADFAESHCCAHASCEQPQLLWWTSWPYFHRIFCPLNKVSLPGGLTHAHALPQLLGIIKVSSASTWRPTSAKLFTPPPPLTVPPGCPRTTTFPHQKQNHRSVIRMYGMGGS